MGGTKKPTISKLKKIVGKKEEKSKKEERKKEAYKVFIDPKEKEELKKYAKKVKYITPYLVSRKMEVKLSTARKILKELAEEGIIKLEEKNREVEIYSSISS